MSEASSRVLTVPNGLSLSRILLIPVFCALIVDHDTSRAGLLLFGVVCATDWVDGWVARRTGQVSELGKVLDPIADRLAILSGLIALVVRGAFPLAAAIPILGRDLAVIVAGAALLARKHATIEVRFVGKAATFSLMVAIVAVSWGNLDLPLAHASLGLGWVAYGVGIVEYAIATVAYALDVRRALAA
jgi:cardiolipin synthase